MYKSHISKPRKLFNGWVKFNSFFSLLNYLIYLCVFLEKFSSEEGYPVSMCEQKIALKQLRNEVQATGLCFFILSELEVLSKPGFKKTVTLQYNLDIFFFPLLLLSLQNILESSSLKKKCKGTQIYRLNNIHQSTHPIFSSMCLSICLSGPVVASSSQS